MARVENNEKSSAECRPSQTKTTSSHSFSIQDILGLDKTQEKTDLYSSENNYFSNPDTVIKIEPGSPTTTHLGTRNNKCINSFSKVLHNYIFGGLYWLNIYNQEYTIVHMHKCIYKCFEYEI